MIVSCAQDNSDILGTWRLDSRSHKAVYEILEEGESLNGLVVYYNDGTTKYEQDSTQRRYAFKDMQKEESVYVDGISGATNLTEKNSGIKISVLSTDTILLTNYVMNRNVHDTLTRVK